MPFLLLSAEGNKDRKKLKRKNILVFPFNSVKIAFAVAALFCFIDKAIENSAFGKESYKRACTELGEGSLLV